MEGVIPNNMECPAPVDFPCVAECFKRVLSTAIAHGHSRQRRILGNYRYHSRLEHFAEKSMGHETADRGRSRLHRLVLDRAVRLAKPASKLVIRCYSKSGSNYFHPVQYKNIVERGL